jgi:hypothetical protein
MIGDDRVGAGADNPSQFGLAVSSWITTSS